MTSNILWQLSTDGGATWNKESYMQLPGFDRVNNAPWMYDDDTKELVKIE